MLTGRFFPDYVDQLTDAETITIGAHEPYDELLHIFLAAWSTSTTIRYPNQPASSRYWGAAVDWASDRPTRITIAAVSARWVLLQFEDLAQVSTVEPARIGLPSNAAVHVPADVDGSTPENSSNPYSQESQAGRAGVTNHQGEYMCTTIDRDHPVPKVTPAGYATLAELCAQILTHNVLPWAARHLIDENTDWTAARYAKATLPWRIAFGAAHPDDTLSVGPEAAS